MSVSRGEQKLSWARVHMPVLKELGDRIRTQGSLRGVRISMALHTEAKTGVLALTLARAGAHVRLASCNPLSTDDDIPVALASADVEGSLQVRARKDQSRDEYYEALNWSLDQGPGIVIDDGGDIVRLLHTQREDVVEGVNGGCEETTTGIVRLRAMHKQGVLKFPMIDINDCMMKHLFDNRYGTGQSTLDGIMASTNLCLASMRCVVAGYGWCGKGIAMRLKGMGARVTVAEVDPVKAVEALMDGFEVSPMEKAASGSDLIITATGCKDVVHKGVIDRLKNGCVLANAGHFDNEIQVTYLEDHPSYNARPGVKGYELKEREVFLLSQGRLVNLAAGQGHPVEIMDLSFALQASGAQYIALNSLEPGVHPLPPEIDRDVALLKLGSMGSRIDTLTPEQVRYLNSWDEGT
ncbi:MAG: adenosylhomocysteinase [Candidatus Thermoplasmatota archaeon]|nr:adenosylhomocysteinase [Candidatus Thermoplasmatota archaeon]